MKIGVISDTHIPINAQELPPQLAKIFTGVELILHGGDIYLRTVLDDLQTIAPVLAAYGDGDERMHLNIKDDPRIKHRHLISVDGLRIGLIHTLRLHQVSPEKAFGQHVDIAVCGHSHEASIVTHQGVLIVNPGSATLPSHQINRLGTVALLNINDGKVDTCLIQL